MLHLGQQRGLGILGDVPATLPPPAQTRRPEIFSLEPRLDLLVLFLLILDFLIFIDTSYFGRYLDIFNVSI